MAPVQLAGFNLPPMIIDAAITAARIGAKKAADRMKNAAGKIRKPPKTPTTPPSVRNPESLRGRSYRDTERRADREFLPQGWKKEPLKKGDGVRYTDGKGGSFEINRGYPNVTRGDNLHKGPYVKTTIGNRKVWVPLKRNPVLER